MFIKRSENIPKCIYVKLYFQKCICKLVKMFIKYNFIFLKQARYILKANKKRNSANALRVGLKYA